MGKKYSVHLCYHIFLLLLVIVILSNFMLLCMQALSADLQVVCITVTVGIPNNSLEFAVVIM